MDELLKEMREMRAELSAKIDSTTNTINEVKTDLKTNTERINNIEAAVTKIPDLLQRVEALEASKKPSYAEAASKPPAPNCSVSPPKINNTTKNPNEPILERARKIVGLYPIDDEHIRSLQLEDDEEPSLVWLRAAEEFLHKELGFRLSQINEMGIEKVTRMRKKDGKTLYVHCKSDEIVTNIFKRSAEIKNNEPKISN